jgi:two-component system sensor histidine kinase HydH
VPPDDELAPAGILAALMPRRVSVQRGFLAVSLVLAALLVVSAAASFRDARRLGDVLVHGEGEQLWHTIRDELRPGPPPSADLLAAMLARHQDAGLRYLAVLGPRDELLAATDDRPRATPDTRPSLGPAGLALIRRPFPPPHRGPRPPPPGHPADPPPPPPPDLADRPPPDHAAPGRPPHLVLEYEPRAAGALQDRSRRDLLVSLAVAAALLVSAAIFHRLQRRARLAEDALLERRHLAALGEMSAVLAHEIRNPLASLKGHAQLLEEQLVGDDRRQAKARRIVDEAVRLERLTTSLLDFVRAGQISRQRSDPRALARRAIDVTDPTRITLDDAAAPDHWSFDPTRVEQALVNLLRNALQASANPVDLIVQPEDGGLAFIVADRGPGVPTGLKDRLFQPFVTGRTQGTGLGLAVVDRVAQLHGGHVRALSRTGGGSRFRVWLPPAPDPPPETP